MAGEREDLPDFKLRLPRSLKDQIDAAARVNNRSINKEIVARLGASFTEGAGPSADIEKRLSVIDAALLTLMFGERTGVSDLDDRLSEVEKRIQIKPLT